MIKGRCFTNLDDYTCDVSKFYKVPEKGELVVCKIKGINTTLEVVQVTHTLKDNEPFIIVELHQRKLY